MNRLRVLGTIVVIAATAASTSAQDGIPSLPAGQALGLPRAVHLRIEPDGGLPASALRRAAEQTRLIWSTAGVSVTAGGPTDPAPAGAAMVAVWIESSDPRRTDGHTVLAWVTLDEQGAPSPIRVSLPGLQETLSRVDFHGRPVRDLTRGMFEYLTAQAVGRVIAHELGHYLLRSSHHAEDGLMRAHYSGATLVGGSLEPFQIAAAELIAMRHQAAARVAASRATER